MFAEASQPASPNRRQQMRARGFVPKSRAVVTAGILLGATVGLLWCGEMLTDLMAGGMRRQLQRVPLTRMATADAVQLGRDAAWGLLVVAAPMLATIGLLAASGNLLQARWQWFPNRILPDFSRLNVAANWARWLSWERVQDGLWGGMGIVLVIFVGITSLWARSFQFLELAETSPEHWPSVFARLLLETVFHLAIAAIVFAIGDYALEWRKWSRSLRQTTSQRREEIRSLEGDPALRNRRRQMHGSFSSRSRDLS